MRSHTLVRLNEVATFLGGGTPLRERSEYFGEGIPWVKTTDLNNGTIDTTEETLSALGLKKSSCQMIPSNAVLVAMYGGFKQIGRTGLLAQSAAINQALTAIPDAKKLDSRFLLEWLNYRVGYWKQFAGSSRKDPNITKSDVADFPVPLFPISYQKATIAVLTKWDTAIDKATALLAALEQRKQGLMQQLLNGRRRLKGFKGKWKTVRLNKLFEEVTRTSAEPLPVMSISAGRGYLLQSDRFNRVQAGKNLENYIALLEGEFAYNKGNSKTYQCGCIYMLRDRQQAAVPNVYIAFRAKAEICNEFYEFYFEADLLKRQLRRIINSGVRNDGLLNLNTKDFFRMEVQAPGVAEQDAIAKLLRTATLEIEALSAQLTQLKTQKRALMQKLLSGEWRSLKQRS